MSKRVRKLERRVSLIEKHLKDLGIPLPNGDNNAEPNQK